VAGIDGLEFPVASPHALFALRTGIASRNSFGELSPRHLEASRALRDRFLSGYTDAELAPRIEALA
jgi:hypothetical protein